MTKVLLLNATYEPLSFVSLRRAIVLLLKDKAEVVEALERQLRASTREMPYPLVIRLITYVPVPRRVNIPVTRKTLFARDNHECQYCGTSRSKLTLDHVVPRSRGGKTEWTNVVAACESCNRKKADKLTPEAKMTLRRHPFRPTYVTVVLLGQAQGNEAWARYLPV